ncbi:hypothetical protein BDK51DRAFT_34988, partial [Blyttiomyces helicus]
MLFPTAASAAPIPCRSRYPCLPPAPASAFAPPTAFTDVAPSISSPSPSLSLASEDPEQRQISRADSIHTQPDHPGPTPSFRRACEPCRARKVKCDSIHGPTRDANRPACGNCVKSGRTCSFSTRQKRSKPQQQPMLPLDPATIGLDDLEEKPPMDVQRVKLLRARIREVEEELKIKTETTLSCAPLGHQLISRSADGHAQSPSTSSHDLFDPTLLPPSASTGFRFAMPRMNDVEDSFRREFGRDSVIQAPLATGINGIPENVLRHLEDCYFEFWNNQIPYTFLHRPSFTLYRNYYNPLLCYAIYALGAWRSNHPAFQTSPKWQAGEMFYSLARPLISRMLETPSVFTVQALLLLACYVG